MKQLLSREPHDTHFSTRNHRQGPRQFVGRLFIVSLALIAVSLSPCLAQETSRLQVQGIRGQFMVDLALDLSGQAWIATEDQGLWRQDVSATGEEHWKQFTTREGLGDDHVYAVACDRQRRIWAGHLNRGVSVFDGERWRNYSVGQGPVGERVFDIAVCPTDGDVWLATNCGLTRYSVAQDTWSAVAAKEGLPAGAVQSIAFTAKGDLVAGMQDGGVAIGTAVGGYRQWKLTAGLQQLPSDLITAVFVTREGLIYAATTSGLARSSDGGRIWQTLRGRDAAVKASTRDKIRLTGKVELAADRSLEAQNSAQVTPPMRAPEAVQPSLQKATSAEPSLPEPSLPEPAEPKLLAAPLLREDYVTCLAQDGAGRLWIGYRRSGYEVRWAQTLEPIPALSDSPAAREEFVRAILPRRGRQAPLVAFYGRGVEAAGPDVEQTTAANTALPTTLASLPTPVRAPDQRRLSALLQEVAAVVPYAPQTPWSVTALADDWSTQGDWLGRYGRYQAVLGAMLSPHDYLWGAGEEKVPFDMRIGEMRTPDDSLRHWVHWLYTSTPEALEMPAAYYHMRIAGNYANDKGRRRQAEWDDHGEEYPLALDGPHLYASLQVPPGWFVLSLYDFNKDGQRGANRWRDYRLSVRARPGGVPLESIAEFEKWPEAARGRIVDFRGGVWKRFLVRGPRALTVEVSRNHSHNTVLAGVFLDRWQERPSPYFGALGEKEMRAEAFATRREQSGEGARQKYLAERANPQQEKLRAQRFAPGGTADETAQKLYAALREVRLLNPVWHETQARPHYLALLGWFEKKLPDAFAPPGSVATRVNSADEAERVLRDQLATCFYELRMYGDWERQLRQIGLVPARDIETALRWDGKSSYVGRGHQVVVEYRQRLGTSTAAATPSISSSSPSAKSIPAASAVGVAIP